MPDQPNHEDHQGSYLMPWVSRDLIPGFCDYVGQKYAERASVDETQEGVELTERLLADALAQGATDIHLDPQRDDSLVRLRLDGVLLDAARLREELALTLRNQVKTLADLNPMPVQVPEDGHFFMVAGDHEVHVRVTVVPVIRGDKLSLRLLVASRTPQGLDDLGMTSEQQDRLARCQQARVGIIAVAGPTGSGKTTTLYALARGLDGQANNIVTIEDPVETELDHANQMQVDRETGVTFPAGLKAMLRLDPDFLVLGEVRETESARLAIDAVVSGRRLYCTLHSRDAVGAVTTLRNLGISSREIAANLLVVISQRLFRKLCEACARWESPTEEEREWLERAGAEVPERVPRAVGCDACHQTGYHGRRGAFEVWEVDPEEVPLIAEGVDEQTLRKRLAERGHGFLLDEGLRAIREGVTTVEEIAGMGGHELGMEADGPREGPGG